MPPRQGALGIMIHRHQGVSDPGGVSLRRVPPVKGRSRLGVGAVAESARNVALIASKNVREIVVACVSVDWCADRAHRRDEIPLAITAEIVAPSSAPSSLGAAHRPRWNLERGFGH